LNRWKDFVLDQEVGLASFFKEKYPMTSPPRNIVLRRMIISVGAPPHP
jgi:hypothetical protein